MHPTNIAIVGGTGTVGKHILAEFLRVGKHTVTAITRSDSTAVLPQGVKVVRVNYDDPSSLVAALRGQHVLIITLAVTAPKDTQVKLVEAAASAGVPYVVTNGWGFDSAHPSSDDCFAGPAQRAVQQHVEQLGKSAWIEFVSGTWYEFSLGGTIDRFGFDFENKAVVFMDGGTGRINASTWEQTARAVVRVFSLKEAPDDEQDSSLTLSTLKNRNLYFKSFLVSQKDMFESVLRATGGKREDWSINHETSADRYRSGLDLLQSGDKTGFTRLMYARIFFPEPVGDTSGAFEHRAELLNSALNLPEEDLDERTRVAVDRAAEFKRRYS